MSLPQRLADIAPELEIILQPGTGAAALYSVAQIRRETVRVTMRDGVRLATDVYLPPTCPAPAIAIRTPYGRSRVKEAGAFLSFARRGYVVISQDVRGTGDSEPESWDYYVHEREDSFDFVEWIVKQAWFGGFLGACGGSYVGQMQWCMALHPRMSAIAPEVSGLGTSFRTTRKYMMLNAYARSVGKGADKVPVPYQDLERQMLEETLAGGYFNEPLHKPFSEDLLQHYPRLRTLPPLQAKRWLWEHYCSLGPAQRAQLIKWAVGGSTITAASVEALPAVFGYQISHDAHTIPHTQPSQLCRSLRAPTLLITGWYDWGLDDTLATWELLKREALEPVRSRHRLLIAPSAHNTPGYHEGNEDHPELNQTYRTQNIVELLLQWYATVRHGAFDSWPVVTYYLMGANEWRAASAWPPLEARTLCLNLGPSGTLTSHLPHASWTPDSYTYHPCDPTPTLGGSIISSVYLPGGVDVSDVQKRRDVLTYTTAPLEHDLDVVGPLSLVVYASSSAIDTDFAARLTDVFPDGRAIQLQNGVLRARYRNPAGEPELLEPGRIYRLEIDLWATANRFKAGHRLRLDISSADFPRYDRNSNRGGEPGDPIPAHQTIYHDSEHPSCLLVSVLGDDPIPV